ncbi:hypothetical protein SAMN05428995_102191 [Loktanella sp. DSM 29012]|uniref:Flp pilus assembly protein TadG n=1 Tax=Loktanella gaetbuli TaxID=2881335 RepID=A0ABS8BVN2_9RHOB|nr:MULTISPECIES: hypothetical protein [Loktanella]MCB5199774.1 hypothetical protein [Loktanella gaetbuli]SEP97508.1 hypothetical protein SAMN05428995_102191 [Loktanella sp. DSM 29012]
MIRPGRALRRLFQREDGNAPIELLFMSPLLLWGLFGTLVYFDAFRVEATSIKTGLTIADTLSRERALVNDAYIDSMYELQKFMNLHDRSPGLRVTVVRYHTKDDLTGFLDATPHYHVVWSEVRGTDRAPLTDQDMSSLVNDLPITNDGGRLIIVETWTTHAPALKALPVTTIPTFTFAAPRDVNVCFNNDPANPLTDLC